MAASEFPDKAVTRALKKWWAEETGSHSKTGDPFSKSSSSSSSVFDAAPVMDSLRAVTCLLVVEAIVSFELPDETVRLGGYFNEKDFLDHIIPSIKKRWEKRQKKKEHA